MGKKAENGEGRRRSLFVLSVKVILR